MLTEWRLNNFKSVRNEQLRLAPLTVLCGANSCGKSSVLHSMLLVSQTLINKVRRRHVVLNGELLKLGQFDDIVHQGSSNKEITIGFSFSTGPSLTSSLPRPNPRRYVLAQWHFPDADAHCSFDVSLRIGPVTIDRPTDSDKPARLQARMTRGEFAVNVEPGQTVPQLAPRSIKFVIEARNPDGATHILKSVDSSHAMSGPVVDAQDLAYEITADKESRFLLRRLRRRYPGLDSTDIVAVVLEHFLPAHLVTRFKIMPRLVESSLEELLETPRNANDMADLWEQDQQNPVRVQLARTLKAFASTAGISVRDLILAVRNIRPHRSESGGDIPSVPQIIAAVCEQLGRNVADKQALEVAPLFDEASLLTSATTNLFTSMRYLGPLRDDPKPVYGIAGSSDPSDVGVKGQYTASVLDLYADMDVDFVHPDHPSAPVEQVRLSTAVRTWLNHFGIAESVETREEGNLGHRLLVRPGGLANPVDLTNVGVGVSQLLPIIVMALISERGAVLLFEQPELHLHPRVQMALADFFLSVIRTGRQCIVETHSEYLVNRLRRRVAESEIGSDLNNQLVCYFVERANDRSVFNLVRINEYGAISDWPKGFFDQGPTEADRILRAAREKQRKSEERLRDKQ